ncbi:MAG: Uma2 family endonuclease [Pseudanabaena sp. Salubria-1]|jgi:Uma2 family endonuclease|nr:Uma2 family endonuclease [Pseudanabaena sp. Salubria-1]
MTFEEYLTYEDGTDNHYEFNDGELVEVITAKAVHNSLTMFFCILFAIRNKAF